MQNEDKYHKKYVDLLTEHEETVKQLKVAEEQTYVLTTEVSKLQ